MSHVDNNQAGSVFDEEEDIFDEDEGDDEGIFEDSESSFDSAHSNPVDHKNALITKEEERADQEPAVRRQLVARFDNNGMPHAVARHANGKQLERWRRPTAAEVAKLAAKGRIVKGGIGEVTEQNAAQPAGFPWKKLALYGGGLAVAGLGGWWLWKKYRSDADATSEDVED